MVGINRANVPLQSAGPTVKKVAYGVALIGLVISAALYLHVNSLPSSPAMLPLSDSDILTRLRPSICSCASCGNHAICRQTPLSIGGRGCEYLRLSSLHEDLR
jgi:hypothetical protein